MHILDDQALADQYRKDVVQAIINILGRLGARAEQFVPQVVPRFIPLISQAQDQSSRGVSCLLAFERNILLTFSLQFFLQNLANLIGVIKYHIKPYLPDFFVLIRVH